MKLMSNKFEKKNILKLQQSQIIPLFVNKYAILHSLQVKSETVQNQSWSSNVALFRNKKSS
jgi:hypothetical protein